MSLSRSARIGVLAATVIATVATSSAVTAPAYASATCSTRAPGNRAGITWHPKGDYWQIWINSGTHLGWYVNWKYKGGSYHRFAVTKDGYSTKSHNMKEHRTIYFRIDDWDYSSPTIHCATT